MFLPLYHIAKVHHIKQTFSMRQLTYLKTICISSLSPTERKHVGNGNCSVYHNMNLCNLTNKWTFMKERMSLISKGYIYIQSNRDEVWRIDELVSEFLSEDLSVPNIKKKKKNICKLERWLVGTGIWGWHWADFIEKHRVIIEYAIQTKQRLLYLNIITRVI